MRKLILLAAVFCLSVFCAACSAPRTFIRTSEASWATIEIREDVSYDKAWTQLIDLLVRNFDLEIAQKENGYIRTGWLYTWTGEVTENYKVRLTVKFAEDRKTIQVKSEAFFNNNMGYDSRLLATYKTDIMGAVGRTTR